MELTEKKERTGYADLIRFAAAMFVLFDHCAGYAAPPESLAENIDRFYIFAGDATLFFMLSGTLLLPMREPTANFLSYRFLKVGVPFILWSLFYLALNIRNTGAELLPSLKQMFFTPTFPEGWFFYALCGLYLIIPFISTIVENSSKRRLQYYIAVWFAAMLLPYAKYFGISGFSPTDNFLGSFFNYSGYLVLGYYLGRYPLYLEPRRIFFPAVIFLSAILLLPKILISRIEIYGFRTIGEEIGAVTASWSILVYTLIQYAGERLPGLCRNFAVKSIAKGAFIIYLCQNFVIKEIVLPLLQRYCGEVSVSAVCLLSLLMCVSFVLLVEKTVPEIWKVLLTKVRNFNWGG